jgi:hypothetical protein
VARVCSHILRGRFILGNGGMIKLMDRGLIFTVMELGMKDSGNMIYSMVWELKVGLTEVNMLGNIKTVRKMVRESTSG